MKSIDVGYRIIKINKKAVAVAVSALFVAAGAMAGELTLSAGGTGRIESVAENGSGIADDQAQIVAIKAADAVVAADVTVSSGNFHVGSQSAPQSLLTVGPGKSLRVNKNSAIGADPDNPKIVITPTGELRVRADGSNGASVTIGNSTDQAKMTLLGKMMITGNTQAATVQIGANGSNGATGVAGGIGAAGYLNFGAIEKALELTGPNALLQIGGQGGTGGNGSGSGGSAGGNGGLGTLYVGFAYDNLAANNTLRIGQSLVQLGGDGGKGGQMSGSGNDGVGGVGGEGKLFVQNGARMTIISTHDAAELRLGGKGGERGGVNGNVKDGNGGAALIGVRSINPDGGLFIDAQKDFKITLGGASDNGGTAGLGKFFIGDGGVVGVYSSTHGTGKATTFAFQNVTDNPGIILNGANAILNVGNRSGKAGKLVVENANVNIIKGTLRLRNGSELVLTNDKSVVFNGNSKGDARMIVVGGTADAPNKLTGGFSVAQDKFGYLGVGTAGAPAFLEVSAASTLGNGNNTIVNGTGGARMEIGNDSRAWFKQGLTVDRRATVSAYTLMVGDSPTNHDLGLVAQTLQIQGGRQTEGLKQYEALGEVYINNGITIAAANLKATASSAGEIGIKSAGGLYANGSSQLMLTASSEDVKPGDYSGDLVAGTVKAWNTTSSGSLGNLVLGATEGAGYNNRLTVRGGANTNDAFLYANKLTINGVDKTGEQGPNGSTFLLGGRIIANSRGGVYNGEVDIQRGTLQVRNGQWSMTNNSKNLDLGANGTLKVTGGTLNLDLGNSGNNTLTVSKATGLQFIGESYAPYSSGTLNLTGKLDIAASSKFNLAQGTLKVSTINANASANASVIGGGKGVAVLEVTGGNGAVNTGDTKLQFNGNAVMKTTYAAALSSNTTKKSSFGQIEVTKNGVLEISGGSGSISADQYETLRASFFVSGSKAGTLRLTDITVSWDAGKTAQDLSGKSAAAYEAKVENGNSISATTELKSLKADSSTAVTVSVAANKSLALADGKVTNNQGGAVTLQAGDGATISLGLAGASTPASGTAKADVELGKGKLQTTGGNYTVDGKITTQSDKKGEVAVLANSSLTTTGAITLNTTDSQVGVAAGASLQAGASSEIKKVVLEEGSSLKVAGAGSNLTVETLETLTTARVEVAGKLTTQNAITATTGTTLSVGAMEAKDVKLSEKSSLTVAGATSVDNLTLSSASAEAATTMKVDDKLTVKQNALLTGGSKLEAKELAVGTESGKTITVGDLDDKVGSTLAIDKLTSGANKTTFFVDPAAFATSFLQVKSLTNNTTKDGFISGQNAIVSLGDHDKTWSEAQMTKAGFAAYDSEGLKPSTFILAAPVRLTESAQILVGEKYTEEGKWGVGDGLTPVSADSYGFALRGHSLLIADLASSAFDGGAAVTLSGNNKTARIDKSASLHLVGKSRLAGKTYTLVDGITTMTQNKDSDGTDETVSSGKALILKQITTDNVALAAKELKYENGALTVQTTLKAMSEVLPGASGSTSALVTRLMTDESVDRNAAGAKFLLAALRDGEGAMSGREITKTIEGAGQVGAVGAVQGVTANVVTAAVGATIGRTSFSAPSAQRIAAFTRDADGRYVQESGVSAGGSKTGIGLWAMPMYQDMDAKGFQSGSFKTGYDADFSGITFGGDYSFDAFRMGVSANVGSGDSRSSGGFNRTKNDFDFWGINLYGGWTVGNLGLSADLGYTKGDSSLNQNTAIALLKADVDSSAWTTGLRAEFRIDTGSMDLIPYAGLRYTRLTVDAYNTKSADGVVFNTKREIQNVIDIPLGVTLTRAINTASGWKLTPRADLGLIAAAGDRKSKSQFTLPGTNLGVFTLEAESRDRYSFDGGLGFEASKGSLTLGMKYSARKSSHLTSQGIHGHLRYDF